jgi:threonine/homoserine/homoserine lactone efflux protein
MRRILLRSRSFATGWPEAGERSMVCAMISVVGFSPIVPVAAASAAWLASALAFAVSMAGTPGPNNAMLASSGSVWGFRRTVPHMLGVSVGFPIMLVAVAGGAGHLLRQHPGALLVMKWLGAAYLLYLAAKIARSRPHVTGPGATGATPSPDATRARRSTDATEVSQSPELTGAARSSRRPLSFVQAALFQWVNPKAWLVTISAVATLTSVGRHASLARALVLGAVFLAVALPTTAFWTSLGVGVSRVLGTDRALRRFNIAMAALLVASVASVLAGVG